jgi:hypothetical protein
MMYECNRSVKHECQSNLKMGNKVSNPFPSFDVDSQFFNHAEISHLKSAFRNLSHNQKLISFANFSINHSPYIRSHFLPRLFRVIDIKKDDGIDFEEYLSAVALVRVGKNEERLRGL